jgi:hypothetical protein
MDSIEIGGCDPVMSLDGFAVRRALRQFDLVFRAPSRV